MEGLVYFSPLLDYVAEVTAPGEFLLVDVGCSGGIDRQWRRLGRRLEAVGIDPNAAEIERLAAREKNSRITYVNALAAIAPEHPFAHERQGRPDWDRHPWPRLATPEYMELHEKRRGAKSASAARAANPQTASIVVPEYLKDRGAKSLDFLKIDVDGKDFDILHSFDQMLSDMGVLGVGLEVNFFGSACETDNTFHNMDRFLKARGFELFVLTTRRYATSALPSRFTVGPGPTEMGRILQGDAMYARDLGSGAYDDFANSISADKILNLTAIFAAFNLPDCAAEVALRFRSALAAQFDVDRMLDLLTAQAEGRIFGKTSYQAYMGRFAQHPEQFLGTKNPFTRLGRVLRKEYLKLRGRRQLARIERDGI
jgi:hypothetical protein